MVDGTRVCAIIPAAGSGTRMGGEAATPKALITLGGVPLILRTLGRFEESEAVDDVVIALRQADIAEVRELVAGGEITKVREFIPGGSERQDSVRLGFTSVTGRDAGMIVVHDAARPFVTADLIDTVVRIAFRDGAAVAAVRPRDTVKIEGMGGIETPDRGRCWLAQTPQAFRRGLFAEALEKALRENYRGTDDVSLVERLGRGVSIVEGSYDNVKITTRDDLRTAEILLRAE